MSNQNELTVRLASQCVVVVGSTAENLEQGPERRLDGREAIM